VAVRRSSPWPSGGRSRRSPGPTRWTMACRFPPGAWPSWRSSWWLRGWSRTSATRGCACCCGRRASASSGYRPGRHPATRAMPGRRPVSSTCMRSPAVSWPRSWASRRSSSAWTSSGPWTCSPAPGGSGPRSAARTNNRTVRHGVGRAARARASPRPHPTARGASGRRFMITEHRRGAPGRPAFARGV